MKTADDGGAVTSTLAGVISAIGNNSPLGVLMRIMGYLFVMLVVNLFGFMRMSRQHRNATDHDIPVDENCITSSWNLLQVGHSEVEMVGVCCDLAASSSATPREADACARG